MACATLAILTLSGAAGSGAAAQDTARIEAPAQLPAEAAAPLSQDRDITTAAPAVPADNPADNGASATQPASLDELVEQQAGDGAVGEQLRCLATAIYYEAGHEPHASQLAVGRVIVARSKSGRFPGSYCAVVTQPSQFSFVHKGMLPMVDEDSGTWRNAVAVARIADAGSWQSPVEGALYFHSAHIAPHWRMQRIARVDNTVFYR